MNIYQHEGRGNLQGSALVVVMGVIFVIAIVASSMVLMGRQQVFSAVHLRDYIKAQLISEAGAIIAAGNVSKTGGWSGMLYSDPTPVPPGGIPPYTRDKVIIVAWQQ